MTTDAPSELPAMPLVTLGRVIEALTPGVFEVVCAPGGLDVPVREAVIHDPLAGLGAAADALVLAVGVDAASQEALALVAAAGGAGAAGVVVKLAGPAPTALVEAARRDGVAVLATSPEAAWGQLHSLLSTATATAGQPSEAAPGGVPLGDLFALANAIAAVAGGPTTIEDPRSNVLAYANLDQEIDEGRRATILGRRVPERFLRRLHDEGFFRRLWISDEAIAIDLADEGLKSRLAIAVRAGGEILGSIWVQEGDRPLGEEASTALREAAPIAALHLLRHRSTDDLQRSRRAGLLRAALEGRAAPEVLAPALGLPPTGEATVLAFEVVPGTGGAVDATATADRAASVILLAFESYRLRSACVSIGPVAYVVVGHGERTDRSGLAAFAANVAANAKAALDVEVTVAMGATVTRLDDLAASRAEADRVLRALARDRSARARLPVATVDDVWAPVLLQTLQDLAGRDPRFRAGRLDRLRASDDKRGTAYVETLRAFLDALGDVPAAAASLDVHTNTFRYRLRRLVEVADLHLDDPVERLLTHLQLYFDGP